MSLQYKQLDFSLATFSNGALLDSITNRIKSEDIVEIGYPMESLINADGHIANKYGRAGVIDNNGNVFIPDENLKLSIFDITGNFIGKITTSSRVMRARVDEINRELYVLGQINVDGNGNPLAVYDLDTFAYKRGLLGSYVNSAPDKTIGQIYYTHDLELDLTNGFIYIYDWGTGCVQKYDLNGNWIELFVDSGYTNLHGHIGIDSGYLYLCQLGSSLKKRSRYDLVTKTEEVLVGTINQYWGAEKGFGLEGSYAFFDFGIMEDKLFIWQSSCFLTEIWNKSDLSYLDDFIGHLLGGKKGQFYGDYDKLGLQINFPYGLMMEYNSTLKKVLFTHETYAVIMNALTDQTALWQNQSLGSAGVINQINVKDNNLGTRNWYIKKSTNSTWTSFEPNKYYSTPLLDLSATETFDIKVEMGNFYEPVKDQIEIEEVSVFYTPAVSLPEITNLRKTNETLTVSLAWECSTTIDYIVQHSKANVSEWETLTTTSNKYFTITYTDPNEQQIPHYFRVIGVLSNGYTQPSNVVVAFPNKEGEENIYRQCLISLKSILENDTRLSDIQEWLFHEPAKTTIKHKNNRPS